MNANEIIKTDKAMEAAAEIVTGGSGKKAKIFIELGVAGAVGFIIYKTVKHISAKRKAKKEQLELSAENYSDLDEDDLDDDYVEDEE